jgi:glutamine amidotransferase
MCRLFGFRSVIHSQVHHSLTAADNALAVQSAQHPDGWGVAYYLADVPHVIKSVAPAFEDQIFKRVSGVVASETVLAHLRKASVGEVNILNAHPFQYGCWTMAHNGEISNFAAVKAQLRGEVSPPLRRYILGDTDSETLFYLFLTNLAQLVELHRTGTPIETLVQALSTTLARVREVADGEGDPSKLTVVVTDGKSMAGVCSGKPLLYSTYKSRCDDRDRCPYLATECESATQTGFVNHLIISSEALQGDNIWIELAHDEVVGVDWRMSLCNTHLDV